MLSRFLAIYKIWLLHPQPLDGANSSDIPILTVLEPPILASSIRIIPLECSGNCLLRFELLGQPLGKAFLKISGEGFPIYSNTLHIRMHTQTRTQTQTYIHRSPLHLNVTFEYHNYNACASQLLGDIGYF